MDDVIAKVIEAGIQAPSGDNSQPWEFVVHGDVISVFNRPDRDLPFFNYGQRGSYVAHGGLLENIAIAARHLGHEAKITLFPEADNEQHVADIEIVRFESMRASADSLYPYIFSRSTNRKPYKITPLLPLHKDELMNAGEEVGGGTVHLVEDVESRCVIAEASVVNERVVLETPALRQIFFDHVVWSEEEEKQKRTGLYVKTLELARPQEIIFRLYGNALAARLFNAIGLSRIIARDNAKLYAAAGAIGIVVTQGESPHDFVTGGRIMQRVWLKATQFGLSMHPVTGVLFLMNRVRTGHAEGLSAMHSEMLQGAYERIHSTFGLERGTIVMLFRIGSGGEPSARSSRLPPRILS